MNEPDHEKLRRELESAASRSRDTPGARRSVAGRNVLIGLLVAVPMATGVLLAIGASNDDGPAEPAAVTGIPPTEDAVVPQSPRPSSPRPPATATGPDVPPHPEPPPDEGRPVTHTVQPGETLARIALRHAVPIEQIAEQNAIADPDRIRAGQNLVIRPAPPGEIVIAPGATLGGYARQHGVTVTALLALNPQITDPNDIIAGGRLRMS